MRRVLVTGAAGFIGRLATRALAGLDDVELIATDVRPPPELPGVDSRVLDVRSPELASAMEGVDVVLHLAAIVNPPPGMDRSFLRDVEVGGTDNVLKACLAAGVKKLVYTSSGAAYGYHADNAPLLLEYHPCRGNVEFAYADHKRQIEELLARYRDEHPELGQLVFRVSTILGPAVNNQITAMFERPVVLGLREAETPFCFVSDDDVVGCLVQGALGEGIGTYNLTGDGVMTLREIASAMGRRHVALPERVVRHALAVLHKRGWAPYGPEQTLFLLYRPVLGNEALKRDFGYTPRTSREAFEIYRSSRD